MQMINNYLDIDYKVELTGYTVIDNGKAFKLEVSSQVKNSDYSVKCFLSDN